MSWNKLAPIPQNEPQQELKKINLCLKFTSSFLWYLEKWRKILIIVWDSSLFHKEILFGYLPIY